MQGPELTVLGYIVPGRLVGGERHFGPSCFTAQIGMMFRLSNLVEELICEEIVSRPCYYKENHAGMVPSIRTVSQARYWPPGVR
jgi:hypothetical protein